MEFRHEWKHPITRSDLLALRARLSAVMAKDPHAVNGRYQIRSLYFDDPWDRALREKIDGVNRREKFRVRWYNADASLVLLEKKSKVNGLCSKVQAALSPGEVKAILAARPEGLRESPHPLVRELAMKMRAQGLAPKTVVDYTREPFVCPAGNVRVTLDYDIRTGMDHGDPFDPRFVTVPAPWAPAILEVKWDAFLPDVIRDIVQVPTTHTAAFSKYAACRVYG